MTKYDKGANPELVLHNVIPLFAQEREKVADGTATGKQEVVIISWIDAEQAKEAKKAGLKVRIGNEKYDEDPVKYEQYKDKMFFKCKSIFDFPVYDLSAQKHRKYVLASIVENSIPCNIRVSLVPFNVSGQKGNAAYIVGVRADTMNENGILTEGSLAGREIQANELE